VHCKAPWFVFFLEQTIQAPSPTKAVRKCWSDLKTSPILICLDALTFTGEGRPDPSESRCRNSKREIPSSRPLSSSSGIA
jgi:hypothetical protein